MTQQFAHARGESEEDDDESSLPPKWRRFYDPSTGKNIFRHTVTNELVHKFKDLFKKRVARKSPPKTTPTKKRKTAKKGSPSPDTAPSSFPAFITPIAAGRGGATSSDPIDIMDDSTSDASDTSDDLPKTKDFDCARDDCDGSDGSETLC